MDQTSQPSTPALPQDPGRWIGRVIVAVLVAEGIWALLSSLTRNLILPFLARQMGGDPQSPLSLGKGDYNFPAIFGSVLELCLAGMVAVILNAWVNRGAKQVRVVRVTKITAPAPAPAVSIAPATPPVPVVQLQKPAPVPAPVAAPVIPPAAPKPAAAPPPIPTAPPVKPPVAKPEKPKPPKEIYYNIVGEPISPTEDD